MGAQIEIVHHLDNVAVHARCIWICISIFHTRHRFTDMTKSYRCKMASTKKRIATRCMRAFLKSTDHDGKNVMVPNQRFSRFATPITEWCGNDVGGSSTQNALWIRFNNTYFSESFICLKMTTTFSCWIICHTLHRLKMHFYRGNICIAYACTVAL